MNPRAPSSTGPSGGHPSRHRPAPLSTFTALALRAALAGLPLVAGLGPGSAAAQPAESAEAAASRHYDVPAGSLASALVQFAQQAGIQLSVDAGLTANRRSPGVSGAHTVTSALAALLAGTGLEAFNRGGNEYTLRTLPPAPAGERTLPAVTVTAGAQGERGLGPVDGYIARRSITATKTDIPLVEAAQAVSIVSADEIEVQNAESITQALRYSSGTQPLGLEQTTSDGMIIRGFNATGSAPTYLNGTKLPRATFSGVAEPYGLERVEVLKGPASVLYGNAAPGGILNLVSKLPRAEPLRELKLQFGSHDRRQLAGDFAGRLNEEGTLTWRLTGLVRRSDTAIDHIPDDRDFGALALRWDASTATSVTVLLSRQVNDSAYIYGLPPEGTAQPNPNGRISRSRFIGEPGFNNFDTRNTTAGYLLTHRFNDSLTFRQNLLTFRGGSDYSDIWSDDLDDTLRLLDRGAYRRIDEDRTFAIDNQLEARWQTARIEHTTLVGLDYSEARFSRRQWAGQVGPLDLFTPVYGSPVTLASTPSQAFSEKSRQLGLYAQQHMKVDGRWVLSLGGRYDKVRADETDFLDDSSVSSYDDSAFTGRVGLVRLFDNGWAPYLSYAQSFQPTSGKTFDGAAFKPTEGDQFEVGVRYQPPGRDLSFTASLYDLTQQNVSTTDLAHPGFSLQEGEVRSRGLELEARARLAPSLNLIASYTFTDNEVTKTTTNTLGNRFGSVPRHMAGLWVDYGMDETLGVGGGVRYYGSSKNLANTVDVAGHTVLDAVIKYRLARDWTLALNLANLTDERYLTCTYACFYGAPRSAIATLTWRW